MDVATAVADTGLAVLVLVVGTLAVELLEFMDDATVQLGHAGEALDAWNLERDNQTGEQTGQQSRCIHEYPQ